jgi:hypothetical protein
MNNYHSQTKPFIAKCFEANMCHISKKDDELILATAHAFKEGDVACTDLIVYEYEEGCFIFAAYEDDEAEDIYTSLEGQGYSKALLDLLRLARKHECKYLQLDRDGVEYEDLPTFKW